MDIVEAEGDTIDAAIENALKMLGVGRDKITVDIIAEGRKGILGFGAQKAKVRAALRKSPVDLVVAQTEEPVVADEAEEIDASAAAEKATGALAEILRLMGFKASVQQRATRNGEETILQVKAENSGLLIGRKGQTLEALQYLVTRIAGERQGSEGPHIVVDVENYRERQRKSLEDMALRLGEKAKRQRKIVTVDALSAADRRVIHAALQDDPWLTTKSLGQGPYRRLLIIPAGDRKMKEGANTPPQERPEAKSQKPQDNPARAEASAAEEEEE
jgi:spoIIIJ-associated protein